MTRVVGLHGLVLVLLLAGLFVLPEYHQGNLARIMVLACFALGYNLAFGYTGLLSLGHAMFFAAGMYCAGLGIQLGGWPAWQAVLLAPAAGGALAVGLLALRTTGVSFMIVTLMFSQAAYLLTSYMGEYTRADEGFVLDRAVRTIAVWTSATTTRGLSARGPCLPSALRFRSGWCARGRAGSWSPCARTSRARRCWATTLSGCG